MITNTGGVQEYLRWGRFQFEVGGAPAALTAYYASWGDYFVRSWTRPAAPRPTAPGARIKKNRPDTSTESVHGVPENQSGEIVGLFW
jgi:hypothetical protein